MLDQEDEGTRIGVWVALGVVFFVLVGVIGGLIVRQMHAHAAAKAKPAMAADALVDVPLTGELLGKLYFESGSAALPPDAAASAVEPAVKALAAAPGKKLVLAGFHDATGDAKTNAELAKQRALAARTALVAGGIDKKQVLLRKPESTTGDGSLQEARRVEIRLVD
jgi:outer membrane protein OmpA-like peptidoglycan-associated protein